MAQIDYNKIGGKIPDDQLQQMAKTKGDTIINAPQGFGSTPATTGSSKTPLTTPTPQPTITPSQTSGQSGTMKKIIYSNPPKEIVGLDENGNTVIQNPQENVNPAQAAYNLTLKPIVDGFTAYGNLFKTLNETTGLWSLNTLDPEGKNPTYNNMKAQMVQDLTPIVTAEYDTPLNTVINGSLQALGGVGATAQTALMVASGGTSALLGNIAKVATTNLFYNSLFYGSGEAIKASKGEPADITRGMLGFTSDGPFTAYMGKSETSQRLDTLSQLLAPILVGSIKDRIPNPDISGLVSDKSKGSLARSALGSVGGTGEYESQQLLGKTLQITKSMHTTDMAIELDKKNPNGIIATVANNLDDGKGGGIIPQISDAVGPQPTSAVLDLIQSKLEKTVEGEGVDGANYIKENKAYVASMLQDEGLGKSNTSITQINKARMAINKSIPDAWFAKMDTSSPTGIKNMLRWQTANALKDIVAEADPTNGYMRAALDVQHTAFATGPTVTELSRKTLPGGFGINRYIVGPLVNLIDYQMEPLRIGIGRAAQGRTLQGVSEFSGEMTAKAGVLPSLQAQMNLSKEPSTSLRPSTPDRAPGTQTGEAPVGTSYVKDPTTGRWKDKVTGKFVNLNK